MAKELIYKIIGDASKFTEATGKARSDLKSLGSAATEIGGTLTAGLTVPIAGLAAAAVSAAGGYEKTQAALTGFLGSAQQASGILNQLTEFGLSNPVPLEALRQGASVMVNYGVAAGQAVPVLQALSGALAGSLNPGEAVKNAARAIGQISSNAKASAEDLNQLAEAGVPAWAALAEALGTTVADIREQVKAGALDATTTIDALLVGMQQKSAAVLGEVSQTFLGLATIAQNQFGETLRAIGEAILPVATQMVAALGPALEVVNQMAEAFSNADPVLQTMALTFAALLAGIGPVVAGFGLLVIGLGAVAAPVTAVAAGLVLLGTAVAGVATWFKQRSEFVGPVTGAFSEIQTKILGNLGKLKTEFSAFTDALSQAWTDLGLDKLVAAVWTGIEGAFGLFKTAFLETFNGFLGALTGALKIATGILRLDWETTWEGMKTFAGGVVDALAGILDPSGRARAIIAKVGELVTGIKDAFLGKLGEVKDTVTGFVDGVFDAFAGLKTRLLDNSPVPDLISGIESAFGELGAKMVQPSEDAAGSVKGTFESLATDVAGSSGSGGIVGDLVDGIKGPFEKLGSSLGSILTGEGSFKSKLMGALNEIKDNIIEIASDAVIGKLQGRLTDLFGLGGGGGTGGGGIPIPGGGGGSGGTAGGIGSVAGGGLTNTLGAVFGGISAVSGILGNFQNARQETTLNAIEGNTRKTSRAIIGGEGAGTGMRSGVLESAELLGYITASTDDMKASLWAIDPSTAATAKAQSEVISRLERVEKGIRDLANVIRAQKTEITLILDGKKLGRAVGASLDAGAIVLA